MRPARATSSAHGGAADMCILGEPTENKLVLAHFGSLWLRLSTHGPFVHTAFSEGRRGENSIVKMQPGARRPCSSGCRPGRRRCRYGDVRGVANVGVDRGRLRLARVADATPDRPLPGPARAARRADGGRAAEGARVRTRSLDGVEAEVYVTAPGAEIDEGHPLVAALGEAHAEVFGSPPERDVTRWFSELGAHALRDRDGQLRDVERPAGRGAGRESRDRRTREDGRGVRARGDEGLRSRGVTVAELTALLERLATAWSTQDTELALSCFTEDAVDMEPPDIQLYVGHEQLRPYFAALAPGRSWSSTTSCSTAADGAVRASTFRERRRTWPFRAWRSSSSKTTHRRLARISAKGPALFSEFVATYGKSWQWHIGNYP